MTEAQITKKVNNYCKDLKKSLGSSFFYQKLSDRFTHGVLDFYLAFDGKSLWLELKATGERPRPIQVYTIKRLRDAGLMAEWTDDFATARHYIDKLIGKSSSI